jgi:hypothetical protein
MKFIDCENAFFISSHILSFVIMESLCTLFIIAIFELSSIVKLYLLENLTALKILKGSSIILNSGLPTNFITLFLI